jgi:tRNA-splicing ligase RtcB
MMSEANESMATVSSWLAMPMEKAAAEAIERVRRAEDVVHIAVMPDVHVANDVCVGTVMGTRRLVYPAAVGGDIGCGMLAIAFDATAEALADPARAGRVLRLIAERIPTQRRHRRFTVAYPQGLDARELTHGSLRELVMGDGRLQFGTLGSGNHFVELQADEEGRVWLMIHSGSRSIGQAVRGHHVARAAKRGGGLMGLDTESEDGAAYLADQDWARRFAQGNREAMAEQACEVMRSVFGVERMERSVIHCDHNHVRREVHFGEELLVHRKGAMPAEKGMAGIVPGSMGTVSFHVEGRGCAEAMRSSAHGAGRLFSRHAARERFSRSNLRQQMEGVWFDPRMSEAMREESPGAYKDVRAVMRAQRELVKTTRTLRPLLVYKGR